MKKKNVLLMALYKMCIRDRDGSAQVQTGTIATTGGNATVSYKNKPTGNNTPGDQDYVQNNFEYDKENGQWVYTQG